MCILQEYYDVHLLQLADPPCLVLLSCGHLIWTGYYLHVFFFGATVQKPVIFVEQKPNLSIELVDRTAWDEINVHFAALRAVAHSVQVVAWPWPCMVVNPTSVSVVGNQLSRWVGAWPAFTLMMLVSVLTVSCAQCSVCAKPTSDEKGQTGQKVALRRHGTG
jgi:hypothetical protein